MVVSIKWALIKRSMKKSVLKLFPGAFSYQVILLVYICTLNSTECNLILYFLYIFSLLFCSFSSLTFNLFLFFIFCFISCFSPGSKKLLFIHPEGLISCVMSQCKERGRWDSSCSPIRIFFSLAVSHHSLSLVFKRNR